MSKDLWSKGVAFILSIPIQSGIYRKVGTLGQEQEMPATQPFWLYLPSPSSIPVPLPLLLYLCCPSPAHLSFIFDSVIMGPQQSCRGIKGQLG